MSSRPRQLARTRLISCAAIAFIAAASPAQSQVPRPSGESKPATKRAADRKTEGIVFRAFPEADAYSSIRREVKQADRERIEARLPFKVHFNELGKHGLLVAFRGRRPVGFVYCRTEEAEWGLTTIAWHMSLDQRITGFRFLRGRSRHLKDLERGQLATDLGGSGFDQVAQLLAQHEKREHKQRDKSLTSIERTTLRSAAKAIAVIESVWSDQVESLRDQATGFDLFPTAVRFTRRAAKFDFDQTGQPQKVETKVLYAYDGDSMFLGCVAWTRGTIGIEKNPFRWAIDRNMRVLAVAPTENARDIELRMACSQMKGRSLRRTRTTEQPLSHLAAALGLQIEHLARRGKR